MTKSAAPAPFRNPDPRFRFAIHPVIARRIRECQVYSEIVQFNISAEESRLAPKGIILSGGPASVYDERAPHPDPKIFSLGIPVLGICYGMQLMAHHLGGQVEFSERREYGAGMLHISKWLKAFRRHRNSDRYLCSHGDKVTTMPAGFGSAAHTENAPFAAMEDPARIFMRSSFILKSRTPHAGKRLSRISSSTFAVLDGLDDGSFIEEACDRVRRQVGDQKVVLGLSGASFIGRGGALAQSDRRPAHLHLR